MTKNDRWLDGIGIASPCTADWAGMKGDDRSRFCSQCRLHVFDLSAMTKPDAEALVQQRAGQGERLCVRFRRRADGTVLTKDCPVGLRQRVRRAAGRVAAACSALLAFAGCRKEASPAPATAGGQQGAEVPQVMGEANVPERAVMGDVAVPAKPPVEMGLVGPEKPAGTPQQPK